MIVAPFIGRKLFAISVCGKFGQRSYSFTLPLWCHLMCSCGDSFSHSSCTFRLWSITLQTCGKTCSEYHIFTLHSTWQIHISIKQTTIHRHTYITELPLRHTIIIYNIYSTVVHIRIPYATYFLRLLRVFKNNLITTLRSLAKGLTFSGLHSSMVSLASILPLPLVGGRSLHSSSLPMGEVDMFKPMLIYECFCFVCGLEIL